MKELHSAPDNGTAAASTGKVGAVLVVGGGIAGIQASLDLANAGFFVYLVEKASGYRRGDAPVGQDLSHQRLLHVHHFPQVGGLRQSSQYRDPGPRRDARPQRLPGALHRQGRGSLPAYRPEKMHRLRGLRPEMPQKSQR